MCVRYGQHLTNKGTSAKVTSTGLYKQSPSTKRRLPGMPVDGSCHKSKGDRVIVINHRLNELKHRPMKDY